MSLTPGTRLGPYAITAAIGAGGMGEVYRATDSHLKRSVAIKVLPASVAGDADRLARFQREAEVLAALNHPNIAAIYGLEKTADLTALVMELVEGEDLSAHMARGAMRLSEALPIAKQIADALEAAHEQGIVHRDLKPANIKVRTDGTVKVLDFGLAKTADPAVSGPNAMHSPTLTARATQMGVILGTAAYMAPEQARGKAVDKRADIWAFGVVLTEMLTGQRVFKGDEMSDVLAAVLRQDIDWTALPAGTPPRLRRLLERCLERDVKQRLRDIGEARVEIGKVETGAPDTAVAAAAPPARRWREALAYGVAVTAVVGAAAIALTRAPGGDADPFPVRIDLPPSVGTGWSAALSPDGRSVVFSGRSPSGENQLYLRRLDQPNPRPISGTGSGASPVFSPDGASIVFIANRRTLIKVPLDGGAPVTLGIIGDIGGGLDWSLSDEIVAGTGVMQGFKGLMRINAGGGDLREFTRVDQSRKELSHQWPRVLSDGATVLFTIWHGGVEQAEFGAASLADGKVVPLGINGVRALDVVDGQLVYVRGDGAVMTVPFDVAARRPSGTAKPTQDAIWTGGGFSNGEAHASLTRAGGLIFSGGTDLRRLVWVDRAGAVTPVVKDVRGFDFVRLSPDGRQAALTISGGNKTDLWVLDIAGGTLTRLTTTGGTRNPSWSPDGRRILYTSTHGGRAELWWQPADASGPPVRAAEPRHNPWWVDLSPDGHTVVFNAIYDGSFNLETLSLDDRRNVREVSASPAAMESFGRFSPDGRFITYTSDESGRVEVYVRPFPDAGARVQVSADGGFRPIWSRDGTRIYYRQEQGVMSASIAVAPALRVTAREALFSGRYDRDFDVARDGRFLMIESDSSGRSLVVIPNWRTELRRLTGAGRR
jgi:serine/threonine-protein kinase